MAFVSVAIRCSPPPKSHGFPLKVSGWGFFVFVPPRIQPSIDLGCYCLHREQLIPVKGHGASWCGSLKTTAEFMEASLY